MPTDNEIEAAAAVLKTNALDMTGRRLDDASARLMARAVLHAAEAVRDQATLPAYRADDIP